jgi:hypothetical protein
MVGLKVAHAFYSAEADSSCGSCDYETPDGRVVRVTAVFCSEDDSGGYFWRDVVYVGVVTKCVASRCHPYVPRSRFYCGKSGIVYSTEDNDALSWTPRISPAWQSFLGWDKFTKSPNRHFPYPMIRPTTQLILRLREPREQHLILRLHSSPQRF